MTPDNIHLFEEHSSTLPIWWAQKNKPCTAVYLDAHLDLQKTSADSLSHLKACTTLTEVRELEAPNHLNPSTRYAFGIENFLYAAHRLKLIDRLVWVAPAHIPRNYSNALVDYMQQMDGITFEELTGFKKTGRNALRGTLLGLDITICDYDELGSLDIDKEFYLDIDIDYFVAVPADRLWIDPEHVINSVVEQIGSPSVVTISRAVSSGFTPMAFRFVGDYIYSLLSDQNEQLNYYKQLYSAITDIAGGDLGRGRQNCKKLVKNHPEFAAAYYILALSSSDAQEKNKFLAEAGQRDACYEFNLARETIGLLHRKKTLNTATLQKLVDALANLQPETEARTQAEVALAQVFAASGNLQQAQSLLAGQTGDYEDHEDVALSISVGQLDDPDKREQNKTMLDRVSRGEKNASTAIIYLGDLEFALNNYQEAVDYYLLAHQRANAWMLPLERMHACYQKLGNSKLAKEIKQKIASRNQTIEKLIS